MTSRTSGACAVLVVWAACGVLAADDPGDAAKLQGTWQAVVGKVGNKEVPAQLVRQASFQFEKNRVTFKDAAESNTATFSVDEKKSPRHLNTIVEDGVAKGQARLAVYELAGDTLKVRFGHSDKRPTSFRTDDGENFIYLELKRVKAAPAPPR